MTNLFTMDANFNSATYIDVDDADISTPDLSSVFSSHLELNRWEDFPPSVNLADLQAQLDLYERETQAEMEKFQHDSQHISSLVDSLRAESLYSWDGESDDEALVIDLDRPEEQDAFTTSSAEGAEAMDETPAQDVAEAMTGSWSGDEDTFDLASWDGEMEGEDEEQRALELMSQLSWNGEVDEEEASQEEMEAEDGLKQDVFMGPPEWASAQDVESICECNMDTTLSAQSMCAKCVEEAHMLQIAEDREREKERLSRAENLLFECLGPSVAPQIFDFLDHL